MTKKILWVGIAALVTLLLIGCSGKNKPKAFDVVDSFDVNRYMGTWYEIARIDFSFERNLTNTTATYSLNDDGTVKVLNRGFSTVVRKWKEAKGKARFRGDSDKGALEVSFFGPFYGDYNVLALEGDYEHVLVGGGKTGLLWILSRGTTISDEIRDKFVNLARSYGYEVDKLNFISHEPIDEDACC